MENYDEIIVNIVESEKFQVELEKINDNYSNLKQESFLRNYILEKINKYFQFHGKSNIRAFAEHPRVNRTRVDLSIVDCDTTLEPFKIEFKYQFSGDGNNMINYWKVIEKSYEFRVSDLFILIIYHCDTNEKNQYDGKWGITSKLSRYISNNDSWKINIRESFKRFTNGILLETEVIKCNKPFASEYSFYLLKRLK